jgi:hypothetical protein
MKQLFKFNDKLYVIIRSMAFHNFENKDGSINMEVLKAWRDHLGCDHVLRHNEQYLLVQTIQDAIIQDEDSN